MTTILLRDLSSRISCGVICYDGISNYKLLGIDEDKVHLDSPVYDEGDGYYDVEQIKPYLRPLSSMTEEEIKTYNAFCSYNGIDDSCVIDYMDWLNSHHFDYRDLISKGLALEAPEGMYETENS